ncbi:hypothetical protein [Candidatus Aciduliprofundum boonei]|uniref:Uncharacterized protein n=1 Tax=Aciduliprofundum boonei (strain DSM 19572 / T469) TaxID=439481 RepID=B5IDT9_ACIB4|nr:hypothetical protein [Candidatus Aciduliprofundum boonei]ADD08168.1 hypothetical protein Aboo_0357 [Aciduliprofundum boonei T469]EDY35623.1 hypothetical protein ABOONEI_160 [Aciduliprofundum boonei T469]HII54543.1 hypothetical protein [Candidatus Aciduliprofundum boonei]
MLIGLIIVATAAYGINPSMNLYREFKSSAMLRGISKESAENIYKIKDEEVNITLFVVSLVLISVRWDGLF